MTLTPPFSLTSTGQCSSHPLRAASDHHFLNLPLRILAGKEHEGMRTQEPSSRMWVELESPTWTLKRILILPISHTVLFCGVQTWIHPFILLILLYHLAQIEKTNTSMPTCKWSRVAPMRLVRLLHKWNHELIPRIWIQLWFTFLWQILTCHENQPGGLRINRFSYSLEWPRWKPTSVPNKTSNSLVDHRKGEGRFGTSRWGTWPWQGFFVALLTLKEQLLPGSYSHNTNFWLSLHRNSELLLPGSIKANQNILKKY